MPWTQQRQRQEHGQGRLWSGCELCCRSMSRVYLQFRFPLRALCGDGIALHETSRAFLRTHGHMHVTELESTCRHGLCNRGVLVSLSQMPRT